MVLVIVGLVLVVSGQPQLVFYEVIDDHLAEMSLIKAIYQPEGRQIIGLKEPGMAQSVFRSQS